MYGFHECTDFSEIIHGITENIHGITRNIHGITENIHGITEFHLKIRIGDI